MNLWYLVIFLIILAIVFYPYFYTKNNNEALTIVEPETIYYDSTPSSLWYDPWPETTIVPYRVFPYYVNDGGWWGPRRPGPFHPRGRGGGMGLGPYHHFGRGIHSQRLGGPISVTRGNLGGGLRGGMGGGLRGGGRR